jgi:hypothetical protein
LGDGFVSGFDGDASYGVGNKGIRWTPKRYEMPTEAGMGAGGAEGDSLPRGQVVRLGMKVAGTINVHCSCGTVFCTNARG